jgi:transcriptional regulator with XRE-family HTH domain
VRPSNPYGKALRTAADALGGARDLAARLGVSADEVESWLRGQAEPPLDAVLEALDLIADGPYRRRRRRRIRVAVLPDADTSRQS